MESERVTVRGGSVGRVTSKLLVLELSRIRECGGVRERLDSLERESFAASSSIVPTVAGNCGGYLWRKHGFRSAPITCQSNPDLKRTGHRIFFLGRNHFFP